MVINKRKLVLFLFLFLIQTNAFCAPDSPFAKDIARIKARAMEIAGYERASIRATDILISGKKDERKLGSWVAIREGQKWTVFFGKLTADRKSFIPAYVYSCPEGKFNEMKEVRIKEIPADLLPFAKAVDLAAGTIKKPQVRRYNSSVFREKNGTITVYLLPGTTEPDMVLLGGDYRVSLSNDGSRVLKSEKLHMTILPLKEKADKPGQKLAGGYHTHVLGDLPLETEVALLILHPVLAPHIIMGRNWMSVVEKDGAIRILGKTEEVLKKVEEEKKDEP